MFTKREMCADRDRLPNWKTTVQYHIVTVPYCDIHVKGFLNSFWEEIWIDNNLKLNKILNQMTSVKDVNDILRSNLFDETTTYCCSIRQAKIEDFLPENQISADWWFIENTSVLGTVVISKESEQNLVRFRSLSSP